MAWLSPVKLAKAQHVLRQGGILAYPTESVYGLGCDPFNRQAVAALLELKHRPEHKGLILVAAHRKQVLALWPHLREEQLQRLETSTVMKPVTWLLPDTEGRIPPWLKGRHSQVAVRISAHPVVQRLCEGFGGALVSTSANVSGFHAARTPLQVRQQFPRGLDFILTAELGGAARPSQIRDIDTGAIVRY
ncbi:MAG TPA: Sua5/YciO/YrdC/YwlC family protein [Pseudomonadales bacterium]|nr:Sua5/YciO/YrdC/YwlC family protein [Pseudomonadales bacterium]